MKILNLFVENIKRIKAIDITPKDNTVVISGKNGNGKSSAIDSIAMVLGGKKLIPLKPVRDGETTAKISVDLGDYKVTRHWTNPTTSYLKLENKDGAKITNAQQILDKIIGDLSFDPLEFSTMEPRRRLEILRQITGLDFTTINAQREESFSKRTILKKNIEAFNTRLKSEYADLPEELETPAGIDEIKNKRDEACFKNTKIQDAKRAVEEGKNRLREAISNLEGLKGEVESLEKAINDRKAGILGQENIAKQEEEDTSKFDDQLSEYYEAKATLEKMRQRKSVKAEAERMIGEECKLDDRIDAIDADKKMMIEEAKMPIDGLSFGEGEVEFNGMPFKQLATSEQIKVSMSIAVAMNPKLRVAMVYNGSLLDEAAMKEISQIANDKDMQIWIERVSENPDGQSIYIENGEIK